eukprot:87898-Chlamydomonas_euryale.AAC.1
MWRRCVPTRRPSAELTVLEGKEFDLLKNQVPGWRVVDTPDGLQVRKHLNECSLQPCTLVERESSVRGSGNAAVCAGAGMRLCARERECGCVCGSGEGKSKWPLA